MVALVVRWYDDNARDLPWRRPDATPWAVMVSEFMLQQTPVERVRAPWQAWLERWPSPEALAAAPAGEAVRAWGRLGYPRRALRLHQAAQLISERFDGVVPADRDDLLSLPGVGSYTAAAIASFAYGRRETVLDTNVRRVLARIDTGQAFPEPTLSRAEVARADALRACRPGPRGPLGGGLDGARRPGVHGPQPALRPAARCATCAPGSKPGSRPGPGRRGAGRATTARTGSAAARCSRCCGPVTSR